MPWQADEVMLVRGAYISARPRDDEEEEDGHSGDSSGLLGEHILGRSSASSSW